MPWLAALVLLSAAAAQAEPSRAYVRVIPQSALLDAPFEIRVTGLQPGARVTLRLLGRSSLNRVWTAARTATASSSGLVSVGGPSLLSQVRPAGAVVPGDRFPPVSSTVRVTASAGGRVVASTTATRYVASRSVRIEDERLARHGFYGEYFRQGSTGRRPGILFLGGSEGGLPNPYAASLLASHGFPVLTLAYFGEPGLPAKLERVPLEYFERALRWLSEQPGVDPRRIVVCGVSRGGEAALLIGSTYPRLVRAVVGYVPSSNVNRAPPDFSNSGLPGPAWTLAHRPVPLAPIAVEKIAGPVLVAGGVEDHLWPSATYVSEIEQRLREHGRSDATALVYAYAGHALGLMVPNIPSVTRIDSPRYGVLDFGGSPWADEAAREASWPRLLGFLGRL